MFCNLILTNKRQNQVNSANLPIQEFLGNKPKILNLELLLKDSPHKVHSEEHRHLEAHQILEVHRQAVGDSLNSRQEAFLKIKASSNNQVAFSEINFQLNQNQ